MQRMLQEFSPRRLFPSAAVGLIAGILTVIIEISLAALVFSGDLAPHLARGIGLTLFGGVAIGFVVTLTTSVPGTIAISQDTTAAVLALVAASIAAMMGKSAASEAGFWTVAARHRKHLFADGRVSSRARAIQIERLHAVRAVPRGWRILGRHGLVADAGRD